jgi:hypothetical protein
MRKSPKPIEHPFGIFGLPGEGKVDFQSHARTDAVGEWAATERTPSTETQLDFSPGTRHASGYKRSMPAILSLKQSEFLKGRRRFELHEGGQLHVATKSPKGEQEYSLELRNLGEKTMKTRGRSLGMWIAGWVIAGGFAAVAVAMFIGMASETIGGRLMVIGLVGVMVLPIALVAFRNAIRSSYDLTIFYNRWTGEVAFTVTNTKPDPATVEQFVTLLTKEIERAAPFQVKGEGLADQIGRLDELRVRGVLTDTEFAAAKQRVLTTGGEEKRIGF